MIEHLHDGTYRYTTKEFLNDCRDGVLTDYDGYGYFATYEKITEIVVKPSRILNTENIPDYPYIIFHKNK